MKIPALSLFRCCTVSGLLLAPLPALAQGAEPAAPPGGSAPPAEAAPAASPPPAADAPAPAPADAAPTPAEIPPPPPAEAAAPVDAAPPAKPKPPPYSLPWQLRSVIPANVVRSDTNFAFYNAPNDGPSGFTVATTLLASYKVTDELAPLVRLGVVSHTAPDTPMNPPDGSSFTNPVLGAIYGLKLGPAMRLGLFLGLTLPIGTGGGNTPDPGTRDANNAGIRARNAMDNAMFAVNDFTVFPGVGFAYLSHGFTAQAEATLLQLTRVRGETAQPDSSRTNFTCGLHVGYFFVPMFSLGAEIRHQRWLSTPTPVKANEALRDTTTWAVGPRFHAKLGEKMWLRPGIAFSMPLDKPLTDLKQKVVQLDVPFVF